MLVVGTFGFDCYPGRRCCLYYLFHHTLESLKALDPDDLQCGDSIIPIAFLHFASPRDLVTHDDGYYFSLLLYSSWEELCYVIQDPSVYFLPND